MQLELKPQRAFTHPMWWIAVALLVINDHLLKGAHMLSVEITGKLSDFAGLMVAPVLIAVLLQARSRRAFLATHLLVGVTFSTINLSPSAAKLFATATTVTPWPWDITVDPSDLIALPMLGISWLLFAPWSAQTTLIYPALTQIGLICGAVACMATSPRYPRCSNDDDCRWNGRAEVCLHRICVQCRDDRHCAHPTSSCLKSRGICARRSNYCDAKVKCPQPKICRDHMCRAE